MQCNDGDLLRQLDGTDLLTAHETPIAMRGIVWVMGRINTPTNRSPRKGMERGTGTLSIVSQASQECGKSHASLFEARRTLLVTIHSNGTASLRPARLCQANSTVAVSCLPDSQIPLCNNKQALYLIRLLSDMPETLCVPALLRWLSPSVT